jgi:DNA mismatch repair protein MutL
LKPSLTNRIKPLSIQLANQIAAGEVVERPASVLKELLENSIDAGSNEIEVDISQGGKALIRINDNGWGIKKEDLPLAVSRHATSKLTAIEDLNHVNSLGFRGEALASISSISRLSIVSKYANTDKAWSIDTASDTDFTNYQADVLPAALSVGTVIEVRDLFYNTPARRKFLRTDKTEFRYIEDVFKRIALSHFEISFKLTHNKKIVKKLSAGTSSQGKLFRLQKIFGENFVQQLKEINHSSQNFQDLGCLHLTGWISNKSYIRTYADQQFFYVNGRYVRDKLLNHALRQAYQETLQEDQYAAYVLYLSIDPIYVDVNVHPTKHEIRFTQSRMVHDFIVSVISRVLSPSVLDSAASEIYTPENPQLQLLTDDSNNSKAYPQSYCAEKKHSVISDVKDHIYATKSLYKKAATDGFSDIGISDTECDDKVLTSSLNAFSNELDKQVFNVKILTVIDSTILAQQDEQLWFVDSIKAAKTINYQRLNEQLFDNNSGVNNDQDNRLDFVSKRSFKKVNSQKLLIPENIALTQSDCDLLLKWQQHLMHLGVEFTFSGPENVMLRVAPKLPFDLDYQLMISSVVSVLATVLQSVELNVEQKERQLYKQLMGNISNSINPLQTFDKNKQQIIINHVLESKHFPNIFSDMYKQSYQVLNDSDIKEIIKSK